MAKKIAGTLGVLLSAYLGFLVWQGTLFIASGGRVAVALGVSMIALAGLSAVLVAREWRFGRQISQMLLEVDFSDTPAPETLLSEDQVSEFVQTCLRNVELSPGDFSNWYHLACAYDMARDRPAARKALRYALSLYLAK